MFAALALYFVPFWLLAAYFVACLVHELCHVIALRISRVKICSFMVELKGLVIEHEKIKSVWLELFCILAGPMGGIIFSYACSLLALSVASDWLDICSAVSLILSIFNLLPCKPLDGGRALGCVAGLVFKEKTAALLTFMSGIAVGGLLLVLSISALSKGYGYGAAAAAICIILNLLFEEGIVKIAELR